MPSTSLMTDRSRSAPARRPDGGRAADGAMLIRPISDEDMRSLGGHLLALEDAGEAAVIAVTRRTGARIGVATYTRTEGTPAAAELSVRILPRWRGRDAEAALAGALADRARADGVELFTGVLAGDDEDKLKLIHELGWVHTTHRDDGMLEFSVTL